MYRQLFKEEKNEIKASEKIVRRDEEPNEIELYRKN